MDPDETKQKNGEDKPIDRKTFLKQGLFMLIKPLANAIEGGVQKITPKAIRPPGAIDELEFLSKCTKCDLCIKACHQGVIKAANESSGLGTGTPIIVPRDSPCYLCDEMICISVCPTGALKPVARRDIKMGVAVIDTKSCLAHQGQVCDYCYNRCPFPDEAIYMEEKKRPVVVPEKCIGCGLCEFYCIAQTPSIRVVAV